MPDPWTGSGAGEGVLVSEQLARRAGLWAGDSLTVAPGTELPILGVYGDYGNPIGQAVLGEALFARLFPDERPTRFGLRVDPAEVPAVRQALRDELGLPDSAMTDQAALKRLSLSIFERTFAVTGALNVLTLAVAGFALLMSLLTLAGLRLPQLAPVWALGLTRARLGRLELVRAVLLAALHRRAGAAVRAGAGLDAAGGGQCRGLRLAAADAPVPVGLCPPRRPGAAGRRAGGFVAGLAAGAHAAGRPAEGLCQ